MFTPPAEHDGRDWAEAGADYGPFLYSDWFDPGAPNYRGPLPRTPPPSGDSCGCPSCASEGYYIVSPLCKFWRAHCDICAGTREYYDLGRRRRLPCPVCLEEWPPAVAAFREALRNPIRAAEKLRERARIDAARAERDARLIARVRRGRMTGPT
jgi:hypothetical protein